MIGGVTGEGGSKPHVSPIALEEFTANQHAPDLAGARADLVELGIAQQAPSAFSIPMTSPKGFRAALQIALSAWT